MFEARPSLLGALSSAQPHRRCDLRTLFTNHLASTPRDSTLSNHHLIAPPNPAEFLNPPLSHSPNSLPQPPIPTTHQKPRNDHTTDSQIQDFTPNNSITFQNNPQIGQPNVHPSPNISSSPIQ